MTTALMNAAFSVAILKDVEDRNKVVAVTLAATLVPGLLGLALPLIVKKQSEDSEDDLENIIQERKV